MQEIISLYLNQLILSLLVTLNTTAQDVLPTNSINFVEEGTVIRVVDGDTIEVYENKKKRKNKTFWGYKTWAG